MKNYLVPYLTEVKETSSLSLFKFISTFAGGGGSSTGYRMAGGECLAINEFIPAAQEAYLKNYPDTKILPGDIRGVTAEELMKIAGIKKGELDLFDGSPPCKSFSVAGDKEAGWGKELKYSGTQQRTDDLFYEYARLVHGIQPKVFIAENVKGIVIGKAKKLLGSSQFDMFDTAEDNTFFNALTDAGYNVRYKVLNACHYGVPTARERAIFIGVRKDLKIEASYPKRFNYTISAGQAIRDIKTPYDPDLFVKNLGTKTELLWNETEIGAGFEAAAKRIYKKRSWFGWYKVNPDKPCSTIVTKPYLYHWEQCRTFSLNELKAISSFPPDYYVGDTYTKGYERIGRAVPPFLMKAIAEHIYSTILQFI